MLTRSGWPTSETISRYTEGDCWILAYHVSQITGAPLVALVEPEDDLDWAHVMVDLGRETLLDVEGRHTRDETLTRWSITRDGPLKFRELGRFTCLTDYLHALEGVRTDGVLYERDNEHALRLAKTVTELYSV